MRTLVLLAALVTPVSCTRSSPSHESSPAPSDPQQKSGARKKTLYGVNGVIGANAVEMPDEDEVPISRAAAQRLYGVVRRCYAEFSDEFKRAEAIRVEVRMPSGDSPMAVALLGPNREYRTTTGKAHDCILAKMPRSFDGLGPGARIDVPIVPYHLDDTEPVSRKHDAAARVSSVPEEPPVEYGKSAGGFEGRKPPPPSPDEGKPGYHTILRQLRPCINRSGRLLQRLGAVKVRVLLGARPKDMPNVQVFARRNPDAQITGLGRFTDCAAAEVVGLAQGLPAGESYTFDLRVVVD